MDNQTVKTEFRQKAVAWLNSKDRNFDNGISILKDAGYKPYVVANFEKNKNRGDAPSKLVKEIRLYIRYNVNPNSPDHEDEVPFVDPEQSFETNIEKLLSNEYPPLVKQLLTEYRDLYTGRSIMHKDLKSVGEQNDEKSTAERKRISTMIDASSRRMDILWPVFEEYQKSGKEPDASLFEKPFNPEEVAAAATEEKKDPVLKLPEDMEELKKMSENWRTKLLKAENMLEFQTVKKGSKPNPMSDGPKRILQEKRIAKLKEEKEAIDLKIAELA